MYREKRRNKIIILTLVGIICLMGAGYAAFKTSINITGIGNISGEWSIRITNVEVSEEHNGGTNKDYTFKDVSATLEADLYNPGDYVIYNITVANNGDFDAKLESLGLEQSTNEAVLITSTGLVSGQTLYKEESITFSVKIEYNSSLYKEESITFSVKIEYNSNYVGDASGTTGMADLTLDFVQNSGGTVVPTEDYLVHYDYTTNGGVSTNAEDEYVTTGTAVNLNYTAVKENAEFIGWNTNSGANEGLQSLTMPNREITLYAIFKDKDNTPPVISNVSTSSTINSITVVTTATEEDGEINHYEYSIDNGSNWIKVSGTNNYTFTGLTSNTNYKILVRVYNESEKYSEEEVNVNTKKLNAPTFVEAETDNGKTVTIIYPEGEGLVYEYQKDGGEWTAATQNQKVEFTESGTLVARVSDGTNEESATYSLRISSAGSDLIDTVGIVDSGDGLYEDDYEKNIFRYRGSNPNNYVTFNGEQWRIISVNIADNTIKIMRNKVLSDRAFDTKNGRENGQYCNSDYCNIYGSISTLYDSGGVYKLTNLWRAINGTKYTLPSKESSLNIFLNSTYYNELNVAARNMIVDALYKAGPINYSSSQSLNNEIMYAGEALWKGKVALIDATEFVRASTYGSCTNMSSAKDMDCYYDNWLIKNNSYWTMTPYSTTLTDQGWQVGYYELSTLNVSNSRGVYPVVTLSGEVQISSGKGTSSSPFIIV